MLSGLVPSFVGQIYKSSIVILLVTHIINRVCKNRLSRHLGRKHNQPINEHKGVDT